MKKFLNGCFNFFWIVFIGLISAISNGILGVMCCITIIGIPLGLQYFKFIKLVFAPAGKVVVTKFSRHPVMNTLWIVFGGFLAVIIYFFVALLFAITIIGIPLSKQLFKIMIFMCAPFGAEILKDGEYSKNKNLVYDIRLLNRRICANTEAVVNVNGVMMTTAEYIRLNQSHVDKLNDKELKIAKVLKITCISSIVVTILVRVLSLFTSRTSWGELFLAVCLPIIAGMILFKLIKRFVFYKMELRFSRIYLLSLISYYPEHTPFAHRKYRTLRQVFRSVGVVFQPKNIDKK